MTLDEIKAAVLAGKRVCWGTRSYEVVRSIGDQWLIKSLATGNYMGLTQSDGVTLNGDPEDFKIIPTLDGKPEDLQAAASRTKYDDMINFARRMQGDKLLAEMRKSDKLGAELLGHFFEEVVLQLTELQEENADLKARCMRCQTTGTVRTGFMPDSGQTKCLDCGGTGDTRNRDPKDFE